MPNAPDGGRKTAEYTIADAPNPIYQQRSARSASMAIGVQILLMLDVGGGVMLTNLLAELIVRRVAGERRPARVVRHRDRPGRSVCIIYRMHIEAEQ